MDVIGKREIRAELIAWLCGDSNASRIVHTNGLPPELEFATHRYGSHTFLNEQEAALLALGLPMSEWISAI